MPRILPRLLLLAALLAAVPASAVEVLFRCRMARQVELGAFVPGIDSVDVAGDFNGWGTDPFTPLADADGDTIYEVAVDDFAPGQSCEYKFRLNGAWDGTEEFPGIGNNRVHTVSAAGDTIDVWYNDYETGTAVVDPGELSWWNDAVFYEIFVRSFQDSDGDGIGDLAGLTARLDYLNDGDPATDDDLGVTGIWLMPINDSPSYHGYDAVDYRAINPDYGTLADFETFLAAAHARGIKVIVDFVMNHCSIQHPWFLASAAAYPEYRDWFRWSPTDSGENGPWGQDVWHWSDSGYYYGLFWSGMPDLNYDTPAVKTEMFETATWWLDEMGVDGFRLDAVLYIDEDEGLLQTTPETLDFWADYNAHVKSVNPDMLSVGEAWTGSATVVQYVSEDRLDLCFEFDLAGALLGAAGSGDAGYATGKAAQVYALYPYLQYATFLTNHDQDRCFTILGEDADAARVAASLYLLQPGVPFLYYGEELGMTGSGDHLNIRTPMQWDAGAQAGFTSGTPWHAVNANHTTRNVAVEDADTGSLLNWYRDLIHLRAETEALRRGEYVPLGCSSSVVMAFLRTVGLQTVLCLVNTADTAVGGLTLTGSAASLTPGEMEVVDRLDPADVRTLIVSADYEIGDLALAAHETRVYEVISATGVDPDPTPARTGLRLEPARPNPFNPSTLVRYELSETAHVRLGVYDLAGREVAVLQDGVREAGAYAARWDGADASGRPMGAGTYLLRLEAGDDVCRSKLTMVK